MSARKRRAARKIAMLVRMDGTRARMFDSQLIRAMVGSTPAMRYWESCMIPLGKALGRRGLGERALVAIEAEQKRRVAAGGRW